MTPNSSFLVNEVVLDCERAINKKVYLLLQYNKENLVMSQIIAAHLLQQLLTKHTTATNIRLLQT